jgi:hypothetical protein
LRVPRTLGEDGAVPEEMGIYRGEVLMGALADIHVGLDHVRAILEEEDEGEEEDGEDEP